ncbi:uncharacterized protein CTRU02_215156 [Colletotrichum truncatum]|uniref:Uncharacterized protein n=1 Tax=Colletotrichum truncatum TaxID=5467 RepID=A0ACC3YDM4_COLTU
MSSSPWPPPRDMMLTSRKAHTLGSPFALIPSDTPTPTVETLCVAANNAWANLEDVAFNPWTADGPVDPLPTPSADSLGYASSSASLEINDTIITVPETILCNSERHPARSIIGNSTIITAPATVVCSPQQRQASSGVGNASKTVFRLGTPEQHPTESFRNALECQRAAQRLMVEAEVEMKYHGLFGSV